MNVETPAIAALNERFLLDFPHEAARELETMAVEDIVRVLVAHAPRVVVRAWEGLAADVACETLDKFPEALSQHLMTEAEPAFVVSVLANMEPAERDRHLARLDVHVSRELRNMVAYPENSAGRVMNPRVVALRAGSSIAQAIKRVAAARRRGLRDLFVVDDHGILTGRVEMEDLLLADPGDSLQSVTRSVMAFVQDFDSREQVVEELQKSASMALPVVSQSARYVGVIRHAELLAAVEEETSLDIQTMVGASPDERAMSGPWFAVRKRLPWLQINLVTAFLAASVVGLFEGIIAKITALAVLLPVVAGQSGNAGAQALAVTMRGLVLREITLRQWRAVVGKEVLAGLINGLAIAATTALGVFIWSRSLGLMLVIALAMVVAMVAAGLAGALVPILLRRFGQDPATASSIILTTVTDVVGFFSFLGIATIFSLVLHVPL